MYRPLLLAACAAGALLPIAAAAQHHHAMPMPGATAPHAAAPKPNHINRAAPRPRKRAAKVHRAPPPTHVGHAATAAPDQAFHHVASDHAGEARAASTASMVPDHAGMDHANHATPGHVGSPMPHHAQARATTLAQAPDHAAMGHAMPSDARDGTPAAPAAATAQHPAVDHMAMDHAAMGHAMRFTAPAGWRRASDAALARAPAGAAMSGMTMGTANGWYSPGSGTARLPAGEGPMRGAMFSAGEWMVMAHGYAWAAVTDQGGPRGADMAFVQSMAMLMADRDLGDRFHLQLRGMGSLEPAMGRLGYPNLFATGETANGVPLVDRQHPHDLFMELAARLDYRLGNDTNLFLYGGPVGEPALGPSAFMHRGSARYQPLSPITHHWFDSTHITYGVVTAGLSAPKFQLEGSWFKGREPDEERWGIDPIRLDSWSVRGTWTPSPYLAVQVSHGWLKEPEVQHPGEDENRTTASVQWARNGVSTTFAWSRKDRQPGDVLNGYLAEATWEITPRHAIFGRVENVTNDELFPDHDDPLHDRRFRVTKAEGGYAYRLPIAGPLGVALGGTVAAYAKPDALDAAYGDDPVSWTLFAKFAVGL